jgi:hypothetical protein
VLKAGRGGKKVNKTGLSCRKIHDFHRVHSTEEGRSNIWRGGTKNAKSGWKHRKLPMSLQWQVN